MADFRKLVLALIVLAAVVVPASAQSSLTCTAAVVPTTVRAEGLAEYVGDTEFTCVGGDGGPVLANIQIWLTTNVTSKIISGSTLETYLLLPTGPLNEYPQPGSQVIGTNILRGTLGGPTSVIWNNVTIPALAAGATQRKLRITNLRGNANMVGAGTSVPGQIIEYVSLTGSQGVTLVNANQAFIVAFVQPGLTFSVTGAPQTAAQCVGSTLNFTATYRELFVTSTKPWGTTPQDVPGLNYFTENGFVVQGDYGSGLANAGVASQGTRLFLRVTGIPAGVGISVRRAYYTTAGTPAVDTVRAVFVGQDATAAGNSSAITVPGTYNDSVALTVTGGVATAVWEVVNANGLDYDNFSFAFTVTVPAGLTIASTPTPFSQVAGGYAPLNTTGTASAVAPHPRFVDTSAATNLFNIQACVTNLLFPFVTNQFDFDTGIALVNTSLDNATGSSGTPANQPFNTKVQKGTCTVYYFGSMGNGQSLPAPQTTVEIPAGQMVTFSIAGGGVEGATQSAATFQGYVIARCNFQYGHGFAFVSDVGANRVSHGYLALVIPDRSGNVRVPDPFSTAGSGSGEQLGY